MPCPTQHTCVAYPLCHGCPAEHTEEEDYVVPVSAEPSAPQLEPELLEQRRTIVPAGELRSRTSTDLGLNYAYGLKKLQTVFVRVFNAWAAGYAEGAVTGKLRVSNFGVGSSSMVFDYYAWIPVDDTVRKLEERVYAGDSERTGAFDIQIHMGWSREHVVTEFHEWVCEQLLAADYFFEARIKDVKLIVRIKR